MEKLHQNAGRAGENADQLHANTTYKASLRNSTCLLSSRGHRGPVQPSINPKKSVFLSPFQLRGNHSFVWRQKVLELEPELPSSRHVILDLFEPSLLVKLCFFFSPHLMSCTVSLNRIRSSRAIFCLLLSPDTASRSRNIVGACHTINVC